MEFIPTYILHAAWERDEVRGARNATTETYQSDRRGREYRATKQFPRALNYQRSPNGLNESFNK